MEMGKVRRPILAKGSYMYQPMMSEAGTLRFRVSRQHYANIKATQSMQMRTSNNMVKSR